MEHGSEYLKDCIELDVSVENQYIKERAAYEFPGYDVDFDNGAGWKKMSDPSKEALDELKKVRNNSEVKQYKKIRQNFKKYNENAQLI